MINKEQLKESKYDDFNLAIEYKDSELPVEGTYQATTAADYGWHGNITGIVNGQRFSADTEGTITITKSTNDEVKGTFKLHRKFNNNISYKVEGSFTAKTVGDMDQVAYL